MNLDDLLNRAAATPRVLSRAELAYLVALEDTGAVRALHAAAYAVKCRCTGRRVALRGLVECGNRCAKDCFYCGIRRSNAAVPRYRLTTDEIVRAGEFAARAGYGSLALQSGEVQSEENTAFFEDALRRLAPLGLGVTLSLGEQTEETYRRWRAAGAKRYLLRIETSNPALYARLHPAGHDWTRRVACLRALARCGYQVGTGAMSCLPGQTPDDLAGDVLFYGEIDADMIGQGPYVPHPATPLAREGDVWTPAAKLRCALNMIAATRLHLHDVNVAATTALETLAPNGREQGLLAGANVIMPNVTDVKYRRGYELYAGKPGLDENAAAARDALARSLAALGETIAWREHGDSPHFANRTRAVVRKS